jgi:hypothetical protein
MKSTHLATDFASYFAVFNKCMVILLIATQLVLSIRPVAAQTTNWNDSPANWNNSISNWDNSSTNWNNSPSNWDNSASNWSATNGVYDNRGNRIGYETQAPSGVTNIYDNNGNRIGYSPSKR